MDPRPEPMDLKPESVDLNPEPVEAPPSADDGTHQQICIFDFTDVHLFISCMHVWLTFLNDD